MTGTDSGRFAPKVPVQLDPPKDDLITPEELAKCDGTFSAPIQYMETLQNAIVMMRRMYYNVILNNLILCSRH
jgi:hypothetical protein